MLYGIIFLIQFFYEFPTTIVYLVACYGKMGKEGKNKGREKSAKFLRSTNCARGSLQGKEFTNAKSFEYYPIPFTALHQHSALHGALCLLGRRL
jgi:hypothetical protein